MKNFILSLALVCASLCLSAQTFTPVRKVSSIESTTAITIAGEVFQGGESKTGSIWITKVSGKTGKKYKQYLGRRTEHQYNNLTVWTNTTKDKWWYFSITDTGSLKRNYLTK